MFKKIMFVFVSVFVFSFTSFAGTYQAIITKITDGDTVWVKMHHKRVKLRLLGIDTPEEYYSKKMLKDVRMCHTKYKKMRRLGLLATKHTRTMLYKGEHVTVRTNGKGYYGRTLAFVILPNGTNYNEKEVADGYACVYKWHGHKSKELSEEEFEKLEGLMEEAKEEKKGLWGSDPQVMECLCGGVVTPVTYKQVLSKQTRTGEQAEKNNKAIKQPTAICRDGTYSYSLNHTGSCSYHGGVLRYLNHAFKETE